MSQAEIPTDPSQTTQRLRVSLAGQRFVLVLQLNTRANGYFMDVLAEDETPIRQSIRVVANFPLLLDVTDSRRPLGELAAWDSVSPARDPVAGDLGSRHKLFFLPYSDMG